MICLRWGTVAFAQPADSIVAPARAEVGEEPLPGLEAFVDGIVASSLEQHEIGGAQVAIVKDQRTLLVKGYGLAAVTPDRAVDAQRSLFRIGSISKTFTWLAVMQLVERGQVELDDPINEHLPESLKIPDAGRSQPIRIVDLMNHTPGFEDGIQSLFVASSSKLLPLHDYLRQLRPARVREPDEYLAYSNYGAALAGALIAHVTGTEYERYMEENVLAPLGMLHTTFREELEPGAPSGLPAPMSSELARHKAQGLEYRDGAWQGFAQEHILSLAPAGSAVSTAADMSRYMSALLNPELLERAGVLERATYEQMREPSFQGAPGLPAVHHGFFNMPLGARRSLGFDNLSHSGGTLHFQSLMALIPEIELPDGESGGSLGVFVTTNSRAGALLAQSLPEQLLTKYFSSAAAAPPEAVEQPHELSDYEGQYRTLRRSYMKLEKLFGLMQGMRVAVEDGFLTITSGREAVRMVEIADDLFRQQNGDLMVAFQRDSHGKVTHAISVAGVADRVGPFDTLSWMLIVAVAAFMATVGILIGALRRRRRIQSQTRWEQRSAAWLALAAAAWLAFWVMLIVWMASFAGPDGQDEFVFTYPQPALKAALAVLLLATAMSTVALATLIPVWRDASWSRWRRVRHFAAVMIFIVFVVTAARWNMLGFRFY